MTLMKIIVVMMVAVVSLTQCEKLNYRTATTEHLEATIADTKRRLQELQLRVEEGERRLQSHVDSMKEFAD